MYIFEDQIRANVRATFFLLLMFNLLIGGLGYLTGYLIDPALAWTITLGALAVSLVSSLFSYWNGRRLALRATGAQPAPEQDYPYLHNILEGLCIAAGLDHVPDLYILDDASLNAFATGRGPEDAAIAFTAGMVEKLDRQELEGVMAHELSHIYNRDTLIMTLAAVLAGTVILLSDWIMRAVFYGGGGGGRKKGNAILAVVAIVVIILAPLFAKLITMSVSRRREYMADATAVGLTRNNEGLASALEKLMQETTVVRTSRRGYNHLFIGDPKVEKSWLDNLLSTHPPLEERVKRLRGMTDDEWGRYMKSQFGEPTQYTERPPDSPEGSTAEPRPADEIPPHKLGI